MLQVSLNECVQPICLPEISEFYPEDYPQEAIALGFGNQQCKCSLTIKWNAQSLMFGPPGRGGKHGQSFAYEF